MIIFDLFRTFFKIGAFTFGGGYAMLPLVQEEVLRYGWMELEQIINFIAVSESTPGPFAVNISTYVGSETAGFAGAVAATLGVVMPSFVIILIVAKFFSSFSKNKYVAGCMSGLKPAVIAMIASAIVSVGQSVFFHDGINKEAFYSSSFISSAAIFLVMLILTFKKLHPVIIILLSAVMGIAAGYLL